VANIEVTLLMSDVRGYSRIAEITEPARLAAQLNEHRGAMNHVIMNHAGIVMQYVGDAVFAVFEPTTSPGKHANQAFAAAQECTGGNIRLTKNGTALAYQFSVWASAYPPDRSPPPCLAQDERFEYTLVGDTVNLAKDYRTSHDPRARQY
jgi:adenylate cyclase